VGSLCAFISEPILSTGGIIVPPYGYFRRARELCDERGMLLVLDEAQTGFGRSGTVFVCESDGIVRAAVAASTRVRGRGLLAGLELVEDRETKAPADALGQAMTQECFERGLSMNIVRSGRIANCLRLAPPLIATEEEIDLGLEIMDASLRTVLAAAPA